MGNMIFKWYRKKKTSEASNVEIESILTCGQRLCNLNTITGRCYERQLDVATKVNELADELDKHEDNVSKTKLGITVVSGAITAVTIGLSFFTLGSTLVLSVVVVGVATASRAGTAAASLAEKVMQNKKIAETNAAILSYTHAITEFVPVLEHFCKSLSTDEEQERMRDVLTDESVSTETVHFNEIKDDEKLCETCAKGQTIVLTASRVKKALGMTDNDDGGPSPGGPTASGSKDPGRYKWSVDMVTEASSLHRESFKTLSAASKPIQIGGATIFGIGLIVDVGTIIYHSIKDYQKNPSEVAQLLRTIADAFDK